MTLLHTLLLFYNILFSFNVKFIFLAFCGQNELVAHFGLGKTSLNGNVVHSIRVVWPPIVNRGVLDGDSKITSDALTEVILYNVPIRQTLIIRRPPTNNEKSNVLIKR